MMVPRSYHYYQVYRQPESSSYDEKANLKPVKKQLPAMKSDQKQLAQRPVPVAHNAAPTPSKPVVIPQPVHHGHGLSAAQTMRVRGHRGGRHPRLPSDHKQDTCPPAVAALLAVTSIPPRSHSTRRRRGPGAMDRRISIDELIQEWRQDDRELSSGYGSPLEYLLESPDDARDDDAISIEPGSEKDTDLLSMRSLSSDSIPSSMPSLEADERSLSSWSSPSTPSYSRREKSISSPPKEDCNLDHPLLHFSLDNCSDVEQGPAIIVTKTIAPPPPKPRSSFKSNLTASIQALKSAAKSFSNFTAPSIPPDDLLTRSILSPRFTSEMRPKQFQGLPAPALRRYLNPQQRGSPPISPIELFHDTLAPLPGSHIPTAASPMIQLQTYSDSRRSSSSRKRRGADPLSEAGRALGNGGNPTVRQREPRENSDFLRVIVMEMNMRREGKLDMKALGKARIWLPPRKLETVEIQVGGGVPARWVSITTDEL